MRFHPKDFSTKKIEVATHKDVLEVTIDWFDGRPIDIYFGHVIYLFLLAFWFFFLAPRIGLFSELLSVIFIGFYVCLAYGSIVTYHNRTIIRVDKETLSVWHGPYPSWYNNVEVAVGDIWQLYVQERIKHTKDHSYPVHELWVKLKEGKDKLFIKMDDLSSDQLHQLETYIERFMGLPDRPVAGEYGKRVIVQAKPEIQARQIQRHHSHSSWSTLYQVLHNETVRFQEQNFRVAALTQYDWDDGNSDKSLQLLNELEEPILVYIAQQRALLYAFREQVLGPKEKSQLQFDPDQAPMSLHLAEQVYVLKDHQTGKAFTANMSGVTELEQWFYVTEDEKASLRISLYGGMMHYTTGQALRPGSMDVWLDLNRQPERQQELPKQKDHGWEDGGLV